MGFFEKIFSGLTKTRVNLEDLEEIFHNYKPDNDEFFDELEELLIMADMGVETVDRVVTSMHYICFDKNIKRGDKARECLIEELKKELDIMLVILSNIPDHAFEFLQKRRVFRVHKLQRFEGLFQRLPQLSPCCHRGRYRIKHVSELDKKKILPLPGQERTVTVQHEHRHHPCCQGQPDAVIKKIDHCKGTYISNRQKSHSFSGR